MRPSTSPNFSSAARGNRTHHGNDCDDEVNDECNNQLISITRGDTLPSLMSTSRTDACRSIPRLPSGRMRVDLMTPTQKARAISGSVRRKKKQQQQKQQHRPNTTGGSPFSISSSSSVADSPLGMASPSPPHPPAAYPRIAAPSSAGVSSDPNEFNSPPNRHVESSGDDEGSGSDEDYTSFIPGATLQERILQAKVAELEGKLRVSMQERDGLVASLKTSISSHEATKARLASVTELLSSQGSAVGADGSSSMYHHQHHQLKMKSSADKCTQAPDVPSADELAAQLEERQDLYRSKDVRAALLSLMDRHDDVKDLLLRNSWLSRNKDFVQRFPSFVRPVQNVAIENSLDGKRPPTAQAIVEARTMPQSELRAELREMARRSNPVTRFQRRRPQ